jgi:RNA polymerase sigma factor (sigma-70 family)
VNTQPNALYASLDDAELVIRVSEGDLQSLGVLFDRHGQAVARFLTRMGVAPADVDDLVQTTFLQVLRAARRFERHFLVRGWLLGIAAMMAWRHRRALVRLGNQIRSWAATMGGKGEKMPDDALAERQTELRFTRALQSMSARKREAFVLVTLEGLSGEEAAMALGVPVNTVWTRLHHARRELRHVFEEDT